MEIVQTGNKISLNVVAERDTNDPQFWNVNAHATIGRLAEGSDEWVEMDVVTKTIDTNPNLAVSQALRTLIEQAYASDVDEYLDTELGKHIN